MMVKISIIIPVYNSALFLNSCIQSLLNQTFHHFELWLVDDGSTDESGLLCDQFVKTDSRVHVIHSVNHGAAHARQLGIEQAKGEYIAFVDSDDTMPLDGLERMYRLAEANPESDIIVGSCRKSFRIKNQLSSLQYRKLLIEGRHNIGTLWGKLFRRKLFAEGIPTLPSHLVMGEDMLINIYLAFATKGPVQLVKGDPVYNYIQYDTGISRRFKLTADYEEQFHKERLRMIPVCEYEAYMPVMIHRRLRMLRRLFRDAEKQHTVEQLEHTDFVRCLVADIKNYHYPFWRYPRMSLWKLLKKASLSR